MKLISAARVKTDARDTIKLARLLAANLIPAVWVPPLPVRELRALVTHRTCLVQQRIQARNRLQGVLQRHNLDARRGMHLHEGHVTGGARYRSPWPSSCACARIWPCLMRSIP